MQITIYKTVTNKDLYGTGNYTIQCLVITCNEKESGKVHICLCVCETESLCCIPETVN